MKNRNILEERESVNEIIEKDTLLSSIFNNKNLGICVTDDFGRFVRVNNHFCKTFGYTESELIREEITIIFPNENEEFVQSVYENESSSNVDTISEWKVRHKNGNNFKVHANVKIVEENGNSKFHVTMISDISEILKSKEKLHLLESVVTNTNDAVVISENNGTNPVNANIIYVNEAFTKITGYNYDEIVGRTADVLRGPKTDTKVTENISNKLKEKKNVMAELINYKKDGSEFWVEFNIVPLVNDNNICTHYISIQRDITDRKIGEVTLRSREKYLSSLVDVQRLLLNNKLEQEVYDKILEFLGKAASASRVYLFFNYEDESEKKFTSQKAEWCADGIKPSIDNSQLENLSFDDFFPRWYDILSKGGVVNGNVSDFPDKEKEILLPQEIYSVLVLPLLVRNRFVGFIGFDNCFTQRKWENAEVDLLRTSASAISVALEREFNSDKLLKRSDEISKFSLNLKLLHKINTTSYESFDKLLADYLNTGCQIFNMESGFIGRTEGEDLIIYSIKSSKTGLKSGNKLNLKNDALSYYPLKNRKTTYFNNLSSMKEFKDHLSVRKYKLESFIGTPIVIKGSEFGVLVFTSEKRRKREFGKSESEIIEMMSQSISSYIEKQINEEEKLIAEEKLKKSQLRLAFIFKNLSDIVIYESGGGKEFVLDNIENLLGYKPEEFSKDSKFFSTLMHPDDLQEIKTKLHNWRKGGESGVLLSEFRCKHANGEYIWLEDHMIKVKGINEPDYMSGILINITDRKASEEKIKKSKEKLSRAQRIAHIGSFEYEVDTRSLTVSDENYRIFNVDKNKEEITSEDYLKFIHKDDVEKFKECMDKSIKSKETYEIDFRVCLKDGELKYIHSMGEPVVNEQGRTVKIVGTNHDVTEQKIAELDLMESEERFKTLILNSTDIITIVDASGRIIYDSPSAEQILGYKKNERVNRNAFDFMHPEDKKTILSEFEKIIKNGGISKSFQFRYKHKNGNWVYLESVANNLLDNKLINGIVINSRDVTIRWKAEESLRRSQHFSKTIAESIPMSLYIFDLVKKEYIYSNRDILKLLGYSEEEVEKDRDKLMVRIIHSGDVAKNDDRLRRFYTLRDGQIVETEYRLKHADGQWRWFYSRDLIFSRTEDGSPKQILGTAQDITDRKEAEGELRKSEEKYRTVVDNVNEIIFKTDDKGNWKFLNPAWTDITGFSISESINKSFKDFIYTEDIDLYSRMFSKLIKTKKEYSKYEIRILTKNKDYKWLEAKTSLSYDSSGNIEGFFGTLTDITERKLVEQELINAKNEAEIAANVKSEFLATMSHEIRTPLNGIIGMTGLLLETNLNNKQKEFVETVRVSGDTLMTLINDILDFSKIESGKMELEEQPFEVISCIEDAFDLFASKAAQKGIDLLYLVDPNVPSFILGDVTRLRQILVNLVSNAIKFTEKGEVFISVNKFSSDEKFAELQFSVKDTGLGIPIEKIEKLFKAFSQVDSSTTRRFGGTGLGLAISSRLVNFMGGRMWVESKIDKGSTFYFTIKTKSSKVKIPRTYLKSSIPQLRNKHVLIVDDNKTNRQILKLQCQSWGMLPRTASGAEEAMKWIMQGDSFDIGIIDMQMPNMNGIELGKKIKKLRPRNLLPLIMLTSLGDYEKDEDVTNEIFDAFVSKPIKQSQLFDVILNVLSGSDKIDENFNIKKKINSSLALKIPLRILVAEDNIINQKLILRILEHMGYLPDVVVTGLDVLDSLSRKKYNLIFMDVQMPEMDGLEATKHIINKYTESARPRIVAMTANAMHGDREICLSAGMDDYISKPILIEEVQSIIEKWGTVNNSTNKTINKTKMDKEELLDFNIIQGLKDLGGDDEQSFLTEVIGLYLEQAPGLMDNIKKYYYENEALKMSQEAHSLKGASLNIGAKKLSEICKSIELKGKANDMDGISEIIKELDKVYEVSCTELKKL